MFRRSTISDTGVPREAVVVVSASIALSVSREHFAKEAPVIVPDVDGAARKNDGTSASVTALSHPSKSTCVTSFPAARMI